MSQENVEIVRRMFEAYSTPTENAAVYLSPEVVWNPVDEEPQHGHDGVRAYNRRWESEWENLQTVAEEFVDAGDSVLVTVYFAGRGRTSGIEVDTRMFEVYTLRDGLVIRMDEFTDRTEALEAVGLSE
jgi:ketosteroid isomerase-like protein